MKPSEAIELPPLVTITKTDCGNAASQTCINRGGIFYGLLRSDADRQKVDFIANWLSGNIWGADWPFIRAILPWAAILIPFTLYKASRLNLLWLSEPVPIGIGVSVEKERAILLLTAVALQQQLSLSQEASPSSGSGFLTLQELWSDLEISSSCR